MGRAREIAHYVNYNKHCGVYPSGTRRRGVNFGDTDCKVFISGPMTGIKNYNRKMFDKAETYLYSFHVGIFNPANLTCIDEHWTHEQVMAIDISALDSCTHILHLPGWERSKGAFQEAVYAKDHCIKDLYFVPIGGDGEDAEYIVEDPNSDYFDHFHSDI